ncbi:MAG: enoyl-CoA hydratase/isomerase family protein [Ramlibacter sp.]|jgi:enoyl-CoA hydratase|nr:enoyl-CoA hydratase/isomerase family protein [Ramlibacter sp.]MDF2463228.1 enoyl-CoA hydratase/isomerase family protein [Ramlibacter sp.]
MTSLINVQVRDGVGVIEFARPEKFNCLSMRVFGEISDAFDRLESDTQVATVLVCAQGKHFCTGAELDEVEALRADAAKLREFIALGHAVLNRIEDSRLPVVAAVQGYCLAGGLEFIMACDIVFAASDAKLGDQHAQFGLVPGWGGSQRLPRLVGQRRAMDLMMSARWLSADDALAWGLVNYVEEPEQLRAAADQYCAKLAQRSMDGLSLMKRLASVHARQARVDLHFEIEQAVPTLMSPDVTEGLAAFRQRREPKFR